MSKIARLLTSFAATFLAGAFGSLFTFGNIYSWYAQLNKPSFVPPNQIFGPVWTVLYIFMAISFYLVWNEVSKKNKPELLWLYFIHLVINALWSVVFFGLHEVLLALYVILLLWILIVSMILLYRKYSKIAVYFLVPYLYWVSFAMILNLSIWLYNI